jgi:beta-phosphoglucomutase
MLRAVIFDFDGVITDSEILHLRAFNHVLGRFGFQIAKEDYYREYLGFSDVDCLKTLADEGKIHLGEGVLEELVGRKNRIFEELVKKDGGIIDGVRDFLYMLRAASVPIAICSGALLAEIELILDRARLRDYFEIIVSAEHVSKGKPDPQGFLLSLERLNADSAERITPGKCVVIEDSHWGLQAAKSAGMRTVAITNSYDAEQLTMADKVVVHLSELSIGDLKKLCG